MKHLATVVLAVALAVNLAQARTVTFQANVPFAFVAGKQTLPAGTYLVDSVVGKGAAGDDTALLVIRTSDRRIYQAIVTGLETRRLQRNGSSTLLFVRYQGKQYLSQVWLREGAVVHQLVNVPRDAGSRGSTGDSRVILTRIH